MDRSALTIVLATLAAGAAASRPVVCQCVGFGTFTSRGSIPSNLQPPQTASEVSGMAASRHNPGVLWIHDDGSAGGAQLIALRENGALAQQYQLAGVTNRDWEDLAIGAGPVPGRPYLYLAETGNNSLNETSFSFIRVAEPDVPVAPLGVISLTPEVFRFRYPSGTFNTETLWIDPVDATPYVLTKESAATCRLFRYPMPLDATVEKTLVLAATLPGMPQSFTGGTVSADGRWVFARTTAAVYAWPRPAGTSFVNAFTGVRCTVSGPGGLAEAIAVAADGRSLWAISEGVGATVWNAPLTFPAGVPVHHAFGSGLAGVAGVPGLGTTAAPRLGGAPLSLGGWQGAPGAFAIVLLSGTGFADGAYAFAGGWLHAAPDVLFPVQIAAPGTTSLPLGALPGDPSLHGVPVFWQMLVVDPRAPQGMALSRGLRFVLDR